MNGQGLSPVQLLERHFDLVKQAESLEHQLKRCRDDIRIVQEIVSAQKTEVGAVQRLLQKQADDKKKADAEAKVKAEVEAELEEEG